MIPRDGAFDSVLALRRDGWEFVSRRCRSLGTDAFETRLAGRRAVCMLGAEAACVFYTERLTRRGALPAPILTLLQDYGSVAVLDGDAHHARKALFLSLMDEAALGRLAEIDAEEWRLAAERWARADHVLLLDAVSGLLCRTACAWAGVPLGEPGEAHERTRELRAMVEGAGSVGPRNLRGRLLRRRTERWARGLVRRVRAGELEPPAGTALGAFAAADLDEAVAAVELLNVLRPTLAAARFVVFAALALHEHPALREPLRDGDELLDPFVHEVRRFYPFFPAIGGRVLEPFEWRGRRFERDEWVLLDLYGTNRDPRAWEHADEFRPERFVGWPGDPFTLVPQGGGDHATGHRCAGEWATLVLMRDAVRALTRLVAYDVPPQDLRLRPSYVPPKPESGFVVRSVRLI